jgi:hypothetical protein
MFSRYRVPLPQPVTDSSSPAFASQAEAWVRRIRKNYDDRANRHRIWYRSSGITVIVAGASLPVLTTIDYTGKNLAISLAGVLVAALTALRAFYRWDHMWALLRVTEFSVSQAYWEWRDAVDGRLGTTDDKVTEENREATRLLVKRVDDLRQTEASSSFKDLPFPDQQPRT